MREDILFGSKELENFECVDLQTDEDQEVDFEVCKLLHVNEQAGTASEKRDLMVHERSLTQTRRLCTGMYKSKQGGNHWPL